MFLRGLPVGTVGAGPFFYEFGWRKYFKASSKFALEGYKNNSRLRQIFVLRRVGAKTSSGSSSLRVTLAAGRSINDGAVELAPPARL